MKYTDIPKLVKQAGAVNDNLASWLSLAYTPTLLTAMTSADAAVRASRQPNGATDKQIREFNKHPGWAWFPGQGLYRDMLREKRVMPGPRGEKHITAYTLSPAMSVLIGAILGAGGGAAYGTYKGVGDSYLLPGVGIGAGAGLLAHIGGGLIGAITPRRTKEDQKKYLESSTLPEWFIPGVGGYNAAKTLGLQIEDSDAVEAKRKKTASYKIAVEETSVKATQKPTDRKDKAKNFLARWWASQPLWGAATDEQQQMLFNQMHQQALLAHGVAAGMM